MASHGTSVSKEEDTGPSVPELLGLADKVIIKTSFHSINSVVQRFVKMKIDNPPCASNTAQP